MRVIINDIVEAETLANQHGLTVTDFDGHTAEIVFANPDAILWIEGNTTDWLGDPAIARGIDWSGTYCGVCKKKHLRRHKAIIMHEGYPVVTGGKCFDVNRIARQVLRLEYRVKRNLIGKRYAFLGPTDNPIPTGDVQLALRIAYAVIEKHGYMSVRNSSSTGADPTKYLVERLYKGEVGETLNFPVDDILSEMKQWVMDHDEKLSSDFISSCKVILDKNLLCFGEITFMAWKYRDHLEKLKESRANGDVKCIPLDMPPSKTVDIPGTWVVVSAVERFGDYGAYKIIHAVNDKNEGVMMFLGLPHSEDLDVGKGFKLRGQVKDIDRNGTHRIIGRPQVSDITEAEALAEQALNTRFNWIEL